MGKEGLEQRDGGQMAEVPSQGFFLVLSVEMFESHLLSFVKMVLFQYGSGL